MKILSNIKEYFKNNFNNNVTPLLETKLGTGAVGMSLGSLMLYSIAVFFQSEHPSKEPALTMFSSLTMFTTTTIVCAGLAALASFATLTMFPRQSSINANENNDKSMFLVGGLLLMLSSFYYMKIDSYLLTYLNTILQLTALSAIALSVKSSFENTMELQNNIRSFADNAASYNVATIVKDISLVKKPIAEELEIEQELGLTSYFKK
jgi:hypothetical protein